MEVRRWVKGTALRNARKLKNVELEINRPNRVFDQETLGLSWDQLLQLTLSPVAANQVHPILSLCINLAFLSIDIRNSDKGHQIPTQTCIPSLTSFILIY